jgi:hypothetical protein
MKTILKFIYYLLRSNIRLFKHPHSSISEPLKMCAFFLVGLKTCVSVPTKKNVNIYKIYKKKYIQIIKIKYINASKKNTLKDIRIT